ncbi:calcium-translocating P-type ATPase, PMCA-type [Edhazardia aedis USNM 41457]|uniref:Calcium-transporting ATPase n=1 Tax=Edhazardia aedis (strain USNM 41457) TaxID=1003232 RepID=J9D4Z0_EDHAE|nr:calcium-translocating P-type ATPase, PMCA-type [Edhazardia aedis USNM 41457]|eukprot:EJW02886.1 calcium-translocating P-type ATPase, PMCA-type [Edhazardia aedis USNM 41457]
MKQVYDNVKVSSNETIAMNNVEITTIKQYFTVTADEFSKVIESRNFGSISDCQNFEMLCSALYRDDITGNMIFGNEESLNALKREYRNIPNSFFVENKLYKNFKGEETNKMEYLYRVLSRYIYGKNGIQYVKQTKILKLVLDNLSDKTLLLLIAAALLSLAIGIYKIKVENDNLAWIEGFSILCAVFLIVLINSFNQYSQEKTFHSLDRTKHSHKIKFFRNGKLDTIQSEDIVVGDCIYLEPGDILPADCILLDNNTIICDESMISGESEGVYKSRQKDPFLISGTYVIYGTGKALVLCVGYNSIRGKIHSQMQTERQKTPLEQKLDKLAGNLAVKALYISLVLLFIHTIKLLSNTSRFQINSVIHMLVESISIIVMAIPEGLPMSITIALSFGTRRMMSDKILVKNLSACETMNNTNIICTDKTGTLTHNEMSIKYFFGGNRYILLENCYSEEKNNLIEKIDETTNLDILLKNIALNSTAFENNEGVYVGSQSEVALLKILKAHNVDYESMRKNANVVLKVPFSSENKYMATVIQEGSKYYVFFKGASEKIIENCEFESHKSEIRSIRKNNLLKFIETCDKKCYRTMGFSYLELDHFDKEAAALGNYSATFLCAVAMEDPLRENVKEKIELCKKAGIVVVMLTGDKLAMAQHLAKKLKIWDESNLCITGNDFRSMSDEELDRKIHKIRVIARASPIDKRRFVEFMQKKGCIVAVTGDGTNDGPALKIAHVGFGMGISGTEIAKEAANIILLNDDFSSLTKCIEWGRCINNSVRKFIQYQLATTYTTIIIATLNSVTASKNDTVFSPIKLLWINLIMDTFAALALSTDKPTENLLENSPEPTNHPIITSNMYLFIFVTATYQLIAISILLLRGLSCTFIFNTFIFLQIFNQINARSLEPSQNPFSGLLKNYIFIGTNLIVIILQFFIVNCFGMVFKTEKLSVYEWFSSLSIGSTIIFVFIIVRFFASIFCSKNTCNIRKSCKNIANEVEKMNELRNSPLMLK